MSLRDNIDNTNKEKENLKTVANNIDSKLVELGGERATDLADVPNKIEKTINENYIKLAKNNNYIRKSYTLGEPGAPAKGTKTYSFEFDIKNDLLINFTPKSLKSIVYARFWDDSYTSTGSSITTTLNEGHDIELIGNNSRYYMRKYNTPTASNNDGWVDIKQQDNKIKFTITHNVGSFPSGFTKDAEIRIGPYTATTGPGIILS